MIKKISDKHTKPPVSPVMKNDIKFIDAQNITNILADEFVKKSSSNNYELQFKKHKAQVEKIPLVLTSNRNEVYNEPFNLLELQTAIKNSKNTSTGPDNIHYEFLKDMPYLPLLVVLDIFNKIWESGKVPVIWKEAAIIPIPKPNKDPTNPSDYRPISLTSFLMLF
jgi:hypothetical protein